MVPPVRMRRKKQRKPAISLILLFAFSSFADDHSHLLLVITLVFSRLSINSSTNLILIFFLTFSSFKDGHFIICPWWTLYLPHGTICAFFRVEILVEFLPSSFKSLFSYFLAQPKAKEIIGIHHFCAPSPVVHCGPSSQLTAHPPSSPGLCRGSCLPYLSSSSSSSSSSTENLIPTPHYRGGEKLNVAFVP